MLGRHGLGGASSHNIGALTVRVLAALSSYKYCEESLRKNVPNDLGLCIAEIPAQPEPGTGGFRITDVQG